MSDDEMSKSYMGSEVSGLTLVFDVVTEEKVEEIQEKFRLKGVEFTEEIIDRYQRLDNPIVFDDEAEKAQMTKHLKNIDKLQGDAEYNKRFVDEQIESLLKILAQMNHFDPSKMTREELHQKYSDMIKQTTRVIGCRIRGNLSSIKSNFVFMMSSAENKAKKPVPIVLELVKGTYDTLDSIYKTQFEDLWLFLAVIMNNMSSN